MFKNTIKLTVIIEILSQISLATATEDYSYKVQVYDLNPPITLSGTVIPRKEVTFTAQLPGRVEIIAGEEGDRFQEGKMLVALDDSELLAQRRAAYAEWLRADAALRNAGIQYSRELVSPDSPEKAPGGMGLPHLFDQFFTKPVSELLGQSDEDFDRRAQLHNYTSQIEQARSTLLGAESRIEQIDVKLRDTESRAPFEGVIVKKMAEVGDTVMMGQPLLQFAETDQLQIEVDVPARLVRGLKKGDSVFSQLDVLDERITVTVAQIFPIADPQRHTIKVKFDIPTEIPGEFSQYVGPGQYAQVEIPDVTAGEQKLILVPQAAVKRKGSFSSVCVLNEKGNYQSILVRLGREINASLVTSDSQPDFGDFISILSGLKAGDVVMIAQNSGQTACSK